jgi:hypothetical protein
MRIIITENQYKTILKENRMESLIDDFIQRNRTTPMVDVMNELFFEYGLTPDHILHFDNLIKYLSDRLGRIKIDLTTPIGKIRFLKELSDQIGWRGKRELMGYIENTTQGLLDEAIDEAIGMSGGDFRKATKILSVVNNLLPRNNEISRTFNALVKQRAEEEGFVVVRKGYGDMGWTFEKGGGRIQQIIDYIKEQPKLPQKTRKGWMEYVGEDPNRKGWMSSVWRTVLDAGIIEKVRDGRSFTYTLGPNAEAFEQGKLIGF